MLRITKGMVLLGVILLAVNGMWGCKGSVQVLPESPINPGLSIQGDGITTDHMLWGMWSIAFDTSELTVDIEPIRNLQAHFDITNMLIPPACNNCLSIIINSFDPVTRIIDADVTLRNPTDLTGYDVRGILYTNDYGHELRNPDDWTGLFDIPGGKETNPFKAFAKDQPNRKFAAYAVHSDKYLVYIPKPPQYDKITYAVDASWPGNCREPYEITNFTQEELYDSGMGYAMITVDVHDWQGDVNAVTLAAPAITGEPLTQLTKILGDTWGVLIQNAAGASVGDYKVEFAATSAASGNLALYDSATIKITKAPTVKTITVKEPNGGEVWVFGSSHSITWSWTGDIPYVNIMYYKDNDEGTAVLIESDVPNTGSYLWNPIPDDPSATVKVRVCYNSDPAIYDDSDGFFFIKDPALSGWARTWGGPGFNFGYGVATDDSGNIYVTGDFAGSNVDFDPGPGTDNHSSNGGYDAFLSKFDSSGNLQWAATWGASNGDIGNGVATDVSGNIYVTGEFLGANVDFDPGPGTDFHSSNGGADVFLSKFDVSGNFQWALTWGGDSGSPGDVGYGVATDNSGNIYVTGYFSSQNTDFDPGPGTDYHSSDGDYPDAFISKFDSSGNFQWALTWGGPDEDKALAVAVGASGNIGVTGYFCGADVDFDPGPGTSNHSSNGLGDIFLSKFDSNGNFKGALTWGGTGEDRGQGIALDGSGNVYITGSFEGFNVDFDPGPGKSGQTSNGQWDVFISKFDSSGIFQWAGTWGGFFPDYGLGVATDASGNIYVTGGFGGSNVDFDPGWGTDLHSTDNSWDIFISKFDSSSDFQWARTWGGAVFKMNRGCGVATDSSGYVYVTGIFSGKNVDFDPGPGTDTHSSNGNFNVFLSKFLPDGYW